MTVFAKDKYILLEELLNRAKVPEDRKQKVVEEFDKAFAALLSEAVLKKLSESDKKEFVEAANIGEEKLDRLGIRLKSLLTEKEVKSLYEKVGNELLADYAKSLYNESNTEQRQKIEKLFKKEVLNE